MADAPSNYSIPVQNKRFANQVLVSLADQLRVEDGTQWSDEALIVIKWVKRIIKKTPLTIVTEAAYLAQGIDVSDIDNIQWVSTVVPNPYVYPTQAPAPTASELPAGTLIQSLLSEAEFKAVTPNAANWVLADGRDVSGTAYATATGRNRVPDLRGAYTRMAGQNNSNAAWTGSALNSFEEDTTRNPRNTAFTTNSTGSHTHPLERSASNNTTDFTEWNQFTVGRKTGGSQWTSAKFIHSINHAGKDPKIIPRRIYSC